MIPSISNMLMLSNQFKERCVALTTASSTTSEAHPPAGVWILDAPEEDEDGAPNAMAATVCLAVPGRPGPLQLFLSGDTALHIKVATMLQQPVMWEAKVDLTGRPVDFDGVRDSCRTFNLKAGKEQWWQGHKDADLAVWIEHGVLCVQLGRNFDHASRSDEENVFATFMMQMAPSRGTLSPFGQAPIPGETLSASRLPAPSLTLGLGSVSDEFPSRTSSYDSQWWNGVHMGPRSDQPYENNLLNELNKRCRPDHGGLLSREEFYKKAKEEALHLSFQSTAVDIVSVPGVNPSVHGRHIASFFVQALLEPSESNLAQVDALTATRFTSPSVAE